MKNSNEAPSKNKIYQTKTVSEKNLTAGKSDLTLTLYLNKFIEQYQIQEIETFLKRENPSSEILKTAISLLLKKYNKGDENFYKLLDLLLQSGVSADIPISTNSQENPIVPDISEKENKTLLMLGIMLNDIDLINIILKYKPHINQCDSFGKNAIIYAILYNHDDSTNILDLLIANKANINSSFKYYFENQYQVYSVFTLACYLDLPKITKCLIDNYVDVNFKITPTGDTGLHLCSKYGKENTLKVLLSCGRINPEITNNEGKRAIELVPDNERKTEIMKLFVNFFNNINNKMNLNNNENKNNNENIFGFQQMNQFNQINKKNINNINSNSNEQQNNNMNNNINNNINNINNNMIDNYKVYMNNVNMVNNNISNINNNSSEINGSQKGTNLENYNFNDSSDLSEENEIKEKQQNNTMNKNSKKSFKNNYFPQYNSFKLLNQKIYHNLLPNSNLNFNIEIPVELIKKKNNFHQFNALNNFMSHKINSTPLLNIDITDKCFDLEIKINELKNQLQEKNDIISKLTKEKKEKEQTISDKKKLLEQYKFESNNVNNLILKNDQKIIELKENQQELKDKIPQDKLYQESNKDNKFYKELKFLPHQIEDTEMFKILNKDLLDYQKYINSIISRKHQYICNLIEDIKSSVNSLTKDYDVQVYGSYANGLCMPWSDLDLVLVNKNVNMNNNVNMADNNSEVNENIYLEENIEQQNDNASVANSVNTDSTRETFNNNNQHELLIKLYYKLKTKPWIKQLAFTENLSIKILRIIAIEQNSEMNIDISFDCEKHNGLKCVNLVKSYLKEYTALKPITIALKAILQSANLHNPNKGGLSSYGLILMVVSYIQSQRENFSLKNEPDLCGKIFYGFLKHYGIFFDFNKYLIVTYPINETNVPNNNDKESYLSINHFSQEFIILDPLNNKNNVANSSFQFMNLKMAFMIAFMVTKEDCDCGCHYGKAIYENSFNSTEHSYLKRMLNSVRRFQG